MDYGPGGEIQDGLNRYWLWDYASNTAPHTLGLVSQQIVDLQMLGELFDPAQLDVRLPQWSIPREWNSPAPSVAAPAEAPGPLSQESRTTAR